MSLGLQAQELITVYLGPKFTKVNTRGEAVYKLEYDSDGDTGHFKTWFTENNKLAETGGFARQANGYRRNCSIRQYWPNGNRRADGFFKNSLPTGTWNFYSEQGELYSTVEYKNGVPDGIARRYYSSGKIYQCSYYIGQKNGPAQWLDENGRITGTEYYTFNKPDSLWISYNGRFLSRKTLYRKSVLVYDSLWHPNGKLWYHQNWENGKLHGKLKINDENGKPVRVDVYDNGQLVKNTCYEDGGYTSSNDCPEKFQDAQFPGGEEAFYDAVQNNLEYPEMALALQQQGDVLMKLYIDETGKLTGTEQDNLIPLGFGMETECLRLLKTVKAFEPAKVSGIAVPGTLLLPFHFILPPQNDLGEGEGEE